MGEIMTGSFRSAFRLGLLTASLLSAPALAQDEREDISSDETAVVCGSGIDRNAAAAGLDLTPHETPQSLTIITREQIDD